MERKLKVLDLFSGIGGFALGLDSTGFFETVKFVEMDKYCQKVLQKNFPNIPIEEDIKNVKGKEYEADVITGGFPCQPFSVAGKQKGTNDNRYLWPEMLRLIREVKPEFVIGENVQGLINLQNGVVLRQVQDQLESEGFEVQCFLIPASGIGAWHQRYRVWIVGHSQHNGLLAAEKRCRDEKDYGGSQKGQNETIEFERTSGSRDYEDVSNTFSTGSRGEDSRNINEQRRITTQTERKSLQSEDRQTRSNDFEQSSEDVSNSKGERLQGWRREESDRDTKRLRQSSKRNGDKIWSESERCSGISRKEDVPNTNTRLSIGENEEIQTRRDTSTTSSEDVSNTDSIRHRGWSSEGCTNKGWSFLQREQEGREMGSETQRCDGNVSNTNSKGSQRHGLSTNMETEQRQVSSENSVEEQQTWWQIESNLCGVPNGISYELDKNRANRIKTLGNAIVPQIAREFGLAIKKVLSDS
jgi:DNA-cytosine methyltransferase